MSRTETFPYIQMDPSKGSISYMPFLPCSLSYKGNSQQAQGLVDSGATINVLPYSLGIQLGAVWENQTLGLTLSGNLANFEARALPVEITIGSFEPVLLGFAWTKAEKVPLILGQANFFMEFEVHFYRSRLEFAIQKSQTQQGNS